MIAVNGRKLLQDQFRFHVSGTRSTFPVQDRPLAGDDNKGNLTIGTCTLYKYKSIYGYIDLVKKHIDREGKTDQFVFYDVDLSMERLRLL